MPPAPKHTPQEEEGLVLAAAASCIEESSVLDFTMSAISKRAGISMGSVYKHIQSKEDVLVALATRMSWHMHSVFQDTLSLPLSAPERLIALFLLAPEKISIYPFGPHLDMLIANKAILQRASAHRLTQLKAASEAVTLLFEQALFDTWQAGELLVDETLRDQTLEQINLCLWSMHVGFIQVALQVEALSPEHEEKAKLFPFEPSADCGQIDGVMRFLNTYPWRDALDRDGIARACQALAARGFR